MLTVILQEGLSPVALVRSVRLALSLGRATSMQMQPLSLATRGVVAPMLSANERQELDKFSPESPSREGVPSLRAHLAERAQQGPLEALYIWGDAPMPQATQANSRVVLVNPSSDALDDPSVGGHRAVDVFSVGMSNESMVARLLAPPPPAAYSVRRFDLPHGVIEHHAALPRKPSPADVPRAVVLCAGDKAAASEALARHLEGAAHVLVAYPDRCARLVMDMPLLCNGSPYTTSFKVRRDLFELLRQATGPLHVDVIHIEETPDAITRMATMLRGLSKVMGTHHLRRRKDPPRLVVCSARPSGHNPPAARIGALVASTSLKTGLLHAGVGLDMNWFDSDPLWYSEHARIYFGLDEAPRGVSQDEVGPVNLGHLMQTGQVDGMLHLGPYLARSIAARSHVGQHAFPVVGFLHSIHGAALSSELIAQLLEGGRQPYDTIVSPSRCGALSFTRLQDAVATWMAHRTGNEHTFPGNVEVIPYGIDTAAYANLDRGACRAALSLPEMAPVVLHMGRIDRREKADLLPLLMATRQLLEKHPLMMLVICGGVMPGDFYADTLMANAHELGIGHAVRIARDVTWTEKRLYHGAADIAVALGDSVQETFGLSLVEAMAARLPVVAAAWNGFREIVQHDHTGLLVPTLWTDTWETDAWLQRLAEGNTGYGHHDLHESVAVEVPALAAALDRLLSNADLRGQYGARGQQVARTDFEERTQAQKVIELCVDRMDQAAGTPWRPDPGAAFVDPVAQRFVHYASTMLSPTDRVVATPHQGANALDSVLSMAGVADRASRQLLKSMVELCQTAQPVVALEQALASRAHVPPARLRMHILRAIKYNVLTRM